MQSSENVAFAMYLAHTLYKKGFGPQSLVGMIFVHYACGVCFT